MRKKELKLVITFDSTSDAVGFEAYCSDKDIKGRLIPVPQIISAGCGIIDDELRLALTGTVRKYFDEHPDHFDPRQYLKPARNNIKELVRHKLVDVLGCAGKA